MATPSPNRPGSAPHRVVITGIGVVCALGHDREAFWSGLTAGRSGIRRIESVAPDLLSFDFGAEVPDFDLGALFETREDRQLDRFAQYALLAGREAVADSGVVWSDELCRHGAVVTGSCFGGQHTQDHQFELFYRQGKQRFHPHNIPKIMANAGASRLSMEFGLQGPAFTLTTACASSNHAIGHAYWLVRNGVARMALAGGSDSPFSPGSLKSWEALRVVAAEACRPFCVDRQGMILGEGGAILVLETLEEAQARGARIYAELAGFGMTADAHHITVPSEDGPARAMRAALDDGGIGVDELDYINAHGTGTQANDANEVRAARSVLGDRADSVAMSSTKAALGHALGAAGALEAAATALAIHHSLVPPTVHFTQQDPECAFDIVHGEARAMPIRAALSNSFAFGGLNAVIGMRSVAGGDS